MWEQLFSRREECHHILRPFQERARVSCRGYSLGLERAVTDLAADGSFAQAVEKVGEHYGVEVSASTIRLIAESHGEVLAQESAVEARMPPQGVGCLIAELDGSLVPCVELSAGEGDGRKRRRTCWHEAQLALVRGVGSAHARYAATMHGMAEAGRKWRTVAIDAGAGRNTHLHCVGDGAKGIARQVKVQFGAQASYLLDLYHVSEYLAAAGARIVGAHAVGAWLRTQQGRLKENEVAAVLDELWEWREAEEVEAEQAPVRKSYRYLSERRAYLDYQSALQKGLPIGSGEIEGGHRWMVQARLKQSGAWWLKENADKMLGLRVCRANGEWQSYWQRVGQAAA